MGQRTVRDKTSKAFYPGPGMLIELQLFLLFLLLIMPVSFTEQVHEERKEKYKTPQE